MPVLDHFGLIAPFYERFISPGDGQHLKELLNLPVEGVVLDAGGGTGRVSQLLTGLAGQVVVADLSLQMLQQAAQKDGLHPVNTHTEALPFADESIERIVMVDALHHVCSHVATAAEMWRVLKPGGRIVIEEPDVRTPGVKLVALAEKLALMRSHFIDPNRIVALFPYPRSQAWVETEGWNSWVIVEKEAAPDESAPD